MSTGSVSCNEASATVLVRFEFMPVIQGYAAEDGRFKWTSRIDGLSMSRITERYQNGKPGFSYGRSEGEWTDFIRVAVNIRDEYQVIQVRRSYTNREKPAEHLSFVLNSATGTGAYIGNRLPLISAFSGNTLGSQDLSPGYPIIRVYSADLE